MSPDIYDDDLPAVAIPLSQQWEDGRGMILSALRVGLTVGSIVGVAAMGIAALAFKENQTQ